MSKNFARAFYNSEAWRETSTAYMSSKLWLCERCGKPAAICHHKTWLSAQNITDPNVALNFDNLEALCMDCHNEEHSGEHSVTFFNKDGSIKKVRPSKSELAYRRDAKGIEAMLDKARKLSSVGSCGTDMVGRSK